MDESHSGLTPVEDLGSAAWLVREFDRFGSDVAGLVPGQAPAHARLLHPAYREPEESADRQSGYCPPIEVSWAEIARANSGAVIHPEVQFESIIGHAELVGHEQPGVWDTLPDLGTMPANHVSRLTTILAQHTGTPDRCWFAIWHGWADIGWRWRRLPVFELPGRSYFLFGGAVSAASSSFDQASGHQSANLWWPDDRAWCVATEVDLMSTYVAGSADCIAELLATPGLECLAASPTDSITIDADKINPPPVPRDAPEPHQRPWWHWPWH